MRTLQSAALLTSTITTGLMAGFMFAYACSVMPGLARSSDRTVVEGMQNINRAIINGWFMLPFLGSIPLIALATVLAWRGHGRPVLPWIIAGLALYLVAFFVTMGPQRPSQQRARQGRRPRPHHRPRRGTPALRSQVGHLEHHPHAGPYRRLRLPRLGPGRVRGTPRSGPLCRRTVLDPPTVRPGRDPGPQLITTEAVAFLSMGLIRPWGEIWPRWVPLRLAGPVPAAGPTVGARASRFLTGHHGRRGDRSGDRLGIHGSDVY